MTQPVQYVITPVRQVTAVSRSNKALLDYDGIDIGSANLWENAEDPSDLEELTRFLNGDYNGGRVVVDCTDSDEVGEFYPRWLSEGGRARVTKV